MKITCVLLALLLVGLMVADACSLEKRLLEVDLAIGSPTDDTPVTWPSKRPRPSDFGPSKPWPCGGHHSGDRDRPRPSDRPGDGGDSGSPGNEGGRPRPTAQAGPSETPRQEIPIV